MVCGGVSGIGMDLKEFACSFGFWFNNEFSPMLKEWSLGTTVNVRNGISKATRPYKEVRKQGTCRTPTFPTKSNAIQIYDAFHRQQAVADKALFPKYLGKRRGQVWNSFGKILPKVGIYPRHRYSESLNYTCFRELNVLFLWVAYVNISQEQGFRKVEWKPALNRIQKR